MWLHGEELTPDELQPRLHLQMMKGALGRGLLLWALVCTPGLSLGDAPLDPLLACTQLREDADRLACFDREMTEIRRSNAQATPVAPTAEQQFGLSSQQVLGLEARSNQAPALNKLHAQVVSVSRSAKDRQIFVLDNSQTWQQIELDPDFPVRVGQEITISKGALGSFWLAVNAHRATRVKRVQSSRSG